uniref:(northern house mosquito) hypothetical protein n=1 Tax=Culex pipiens TaxID=7175 RepID=A0A8D8NIH2_CULPI
MLQQLRDYSIHLTSQKLEAELELFPANLLINRITQFLKTSDKQRNFQCQLLQVSPNSLMLMHMVHLVEGCPLVKYHFERARHPPVDVAHLLHLVHVQEELEVAFGVLLVEPVRLTTRGRTPRCRRARRAGIPVPGGTSRPTAGRHPTLAGTDPRGGTTAGTSALLAVR